MTRRVGDQPTTDEPGAHFETEHLRSGLRGRSVRGGVATLVAQALGFLIKLGSLAALARLVTKEDFGLIFAVTAITSFISTVNEFGLAAATQQRAHLDHEQVTALFWVNVAMSLVAVALTAAIIPAAVWLYHGDTRLVSIMLAYAAMSIFDGVAVQHQALLRRQMRFRTLGGIEVASLAASRIVAIVMAWCGAGYWALVAQAAVIRAVSAGGVWVACGWRPGRPAWSSSIRPMLAFGGNLTGVRLLGDLTLNLDRIVLRRFAGEAATGIYGNVYRLLQLPIRSLTWPLTTVALPVLSRLQADPERFRVYWRRASSLLAIVQVPLVVFMAVAADGVVLTVLGSQWAEAARVFRVLAPSALIVALTPGIAWAYAALGRTDRQVRWTAASSVVRGIAILIGAPWGCLGVAVAASASTVCLRVPGVMYCFRGSPLRLADLAQAAWRPFLASVVAGAALSVAERFGSPLGSAVLGLVMHGGLFAITYAASWLLIPGGRRELGEIVRLARELRARVPRTAPDAATRPARHSDGRSPSTVSPHEMAVSQLPFVSVVIPVYNDAERLALCLRALTEQTYPPERFEIVIVDNGSTDHLAAVVRDVPNVVFAREPRPGSYAARNAGLALAVGEVIAFTDSDCTPRQDWIANGVARLLEVPNCGLVGGAVEFTFAAPDRVSICERYDSMFYFDQADYIRRGRFACTANAFTQASVIRRVGAFDADLKSVGDREWGNRVSAAGYALVYAGEAVVRHPARRTLQDLLRKRRRLAGGHHDMIRRKGLAALRLLNALRRHLIRDPLLCAGQMLLRARAIGPRVALGILSVYTLLCYAEALELVRLRAGGQPRR